jgi:hypothetical protein
MGERFGTSTRITMGPRLLGGGSEMRVSTARVSAGGSIPSNPAANGSTGGATEPCIVVRS